MPRRGMIDVESQSVMCRDCAEILDLRVVPSDPTYGEVTPSTSASMVETLRRCGWFCPTSDMPRAPGGWRCRPCHLQLVWRHELDQDDPPSLVGALCELCDGSGEYKLQRGLFPPGPCPRCAGHGYMR